MVHDPEHEETFGADLAALLTGIFTEADMPTEIGVFNRIDQLMKYWTPEKRSKKAKRQLRDNEGRFKEELFDLDWLKDFGKPKKKRAELPAARARTDTTPLGLEEGGVEEVDELNLPDEPLKSPTYNLAEFNAAHAAIQPTGAQPRVPHWYLSDPATASLLRRWLSSMQFQPDGDWRTRGFLDDPDHAKKLQAALAQVEGVEVVEEDPYTGEEVRADISPIQAKTLVAANISDRIAGTISNEQLNDFVLRVNTVFDPYEAISARRMTPEEAAKLLAEQHPYLDSSDFSTTRENGMDVLDAAPGEMYILDTATGKIAVAPTIPGYQNDPKDRFITAEVGTPEGDTMVRDHLTSKIVRWWADTSNDNHVGSLAIQQVMHERLGDDVPVAPWDIEPDTLLQVAPIVTDHRDTINAILDAQQAQTLGLLDALGIDQMRINRGLKVDEEGLDDAFSDPEAVRAWIENLDASGQEFGMTTVGTVQRPLSSWARDVHVAANFANDPDPDMEQFLLTTVVPKEEIMATALTGFGSFGESEVIPIAKLRPARVLHAVTTQAHRVPMRDALRDADLNSKLHEETILDLTINPDPNDLNADWIKTPKTRAQLYEDFDFPDIGWDALGGKTDELNLPEIDWDTTEQVDEMNAPEATHRGQHQPPDPEDAVSLDNLADPEIGTFPDDVYDTLQYYIHDPKPSQSDREAMDVVRQVRGNPDAPVTVYRAAPKGVDAINPGDWVTTSPTYAEQHRLSREGGDEEFHVVSGTVPAGTIHSGGNDIIEWGYWGDEPVPNGGTTIPETETAPQAFTDSTREDIAKIVAHDTPLPGWDAQKIGEGMSEPYIWANPETGQRMVVKTSRAFDEDPTEAILAEKFAAEVFRSAGFPEMMDAEVSDNQEAVALSHATDSVPGGSSEVWGKLGREDRNAAADALADPMQAVRLVLLDAVGRNADRHSGNFMIGYHPDGQTVVVPIDHGEFSRTYRSDDEDDGGWPDPESYIRDWMSEGTDLARPVLKNMRAQYDSDEEFHDAMVEEVTAYAHHLERNVPQFPYDYNGLTQTWVDHVYQLQEHVEPVVEELMHLAGVNWPPRGEEELPEIDWDTEEEADELNLPEIGWDTPEEVDEMNTTGTHIRPGDPIPEDWPELIRDHIAWAPVDDLKKLAGNKPFNEWIPPGDRPERYTSPEKIDALAEDMKKNGIAPGTLEVHYNPETGDAVLGEGNHRLEAAQRAGITHMPVAVLRNKFLTDSPTRAQPDADFGFDDRLDPAKIPDLLSDIRLLTPEEEAARDTEYAEKERQRREREARQEQEYQEALERERVETGIAPPVEEEVGDVTVDDLLRALGIPPAAEEPVDELNLPNVARDTVTEEGFHTAATVLEPDGTQPRPETLGREEATTEQILALWLQKMKIPVEGDTVDAAIEAMPRGSKDLQAQMVAIRKISDALHDVPLEDLAAMVEAVPTPYRWDREIGPTAHFLPSDFFSYQFMNKSSRDLGTDKYRYKNKNGISGEEDFRKSLTEAVPGQQLIYDREHELIYVLDKPVELSEYYNDGLSTAIVGTPEAETMMRDHHVKQVLDWWRYSTNDEHVGSLAVQQTIDRLYGKGDSASWAISPDLQHQVDAFIAEHGATMERALVAQKDLTGELFRALDLQQIRVSRGVVLTDETLSKAFADEAQVRRMIDEALETGEPGVVVVPTIQRPVSAWSRDINKAAAFASTDFNTETQKALEDSDSAYGFLVVSDIPAGDLFSVPLTGIGEFSETELVTFAGTKNSAVLYQPTESGVLPEHNAYKSLSGGEGVTQIINTYTSGKPLTDVLMGVGEDSQFNVDIDELNSDWIQHVSSIAKKVSKELFEGIRKRRKDQPHEMRNYRARIARDREWRATQRAEQQPVEEVDELNLPTEAAPFPQELDDETQAVIASAKSQYEPPPGWTDYEIGEGDSHPYIWENDETGVEIIVKGPRDRKLVAPSGQFHEILAEKFGAEAFRAAGFPEAPDVHLNSDGTLAGMSHASDSLPYGLMPAVTWSELREGQRDQIIGMLADPWQPMNLVLSDIAGMHVDRHGDNFMVGVRADGTAVVIPIDNGSYLYPGTEWSYSRASKIAEEIDFLSPSFQRMVRFSLERIVKENKLTKEETDELVYRKVMDHIALMGSTAPDLGEDFAEFRGRYLASVEKMEDEAPLIAEALVSFIDPVVYSEGKFDAEKLGKISDEKELTPQELRRRKLKGRGGTGGVFYPEERLPTEPIEELPESPEGEDVSGPGVEFLSVDETH